MARRSAGHGREEVRPDQETEGPRGTPPRSPRSGLEGLPDAMARILEETLLQLSDHAEVRLQQRGISRRAVTLAFDHGRAYHAGKGRSAYYLGRRAIKHSRARKRELARYQGIAVILGRDSRVVTAYHLDKIPWFWKPASTGKCR